MTAPNNPTNDTQTENPVTTTTMQPTAQPHPAGQLPALDATDLAMIELGLRPAACGRCGGRVYTFDGEPGPFQCIRPECAVC